MPGHSICNIIKSTWWAFCGKQKNTTGFSSYDLTSISYWIKSLWRSMLLLRKSFGLNPGWTRREYLSCLIRHVSESVHNLGLPVVRMKIPHYTVHPHWNHRPPCGNENNCLANACVYTESRTVAWGVFSPWPHACIKQYYTAGLMSPEVLDKQNSGRIEYTYITRWVE